jgi:hypothetical protein
VDSNEVPPPDQPFNGQGPVSEQIVPPPMFQVKYETSFAEGFLGGIVSWRTYSLQNIGEQSERIKWIAINKREECLAVPVWSSSNTTISALSVLSKDSDNPVADFLQIEIGQSAPITFPENCGEPVRLKVGTDRGEFDIGPLTFY